MRNLYGIPYFGFDTQETEEHIKQLKSSHTLYYSSLYEMIQSEKSETKLVIIKDECGTWLTYLRDICFNYRDKEVYVPYFSYETLIINNEYKKKYRGHVHKINEYQLAIRHNYRLNKKPVDIDKNNELLLYDFTTDRAYTVKFDTWYNKGLFSIQELYKLYLESCNAYNDHRLFKHVEGYHYINKSIKGIVNHEREFRKQYGLSDIQDSLEPVTLNYRDVRNLTKTEYEVKVGVNFSDKSYWERLLDFESLLYCLLRANVKSDNEEFNSEYAQLGIERNIVKYGLNNSIKLIFKDYWLDTYRPHIKSYSWNRRRRNI